MKATGRVYLGDGVYASYDGYYITLEANVPTTDTIAIEQYTWLALVRYVEQIWGKAKDGE